MSAIPREAARGRATNARPRAPRSPRCAPTASRGRAPGVEPNRRLQPDRTGPGRTGWRFGSKPSCVCGAYGGLEAAGRRQERKWEMVFVVKAPVLGEQTPALWQCHAPGSCVEHSAMVTPGSCICLDHRTQRHREKPPLDAVSRLQWLRLSGRAGSTACFLQIAGRPVRMSTCIPEGDLRGATWSRQVTEDSSALSTRGCTKDKIQHRDTRTATRSHRSFSKKAVSRPEATPAALLYAPREGLAHSSAQMEAPFPERPCQHQVTF
ncbi:uncharacterized protein LOC119471564 [Cebus imitator]|uniref:uncharacterized protein LOC119471564 n=1 Tax=Cebus imitator TaxID=2715852 RepID=UPI00189BC478|nr:uncharacterized protein LOC119471564 [Cebus imitator]